MLVSVVILKKIIKFSIIISAIFFFIKFSNAATQGSLSHTASNGNATIYIGLTHGSNISYIDDSIFGNWNGIDDETNVDDLCIYSNTAGGSYNITVTGNGPGSSFKVTDGFGDYMNYYIKWNDKAGANSGEETLSSGIILTRQKDADTSSIDCSTGTDLNARITITFLSSDLSNATSNTYSGSITI